ncbi:replication-relaxation family protein [Cerasicoccus maritimus]|uniref:replication-relaxation family protein n=1 Tax=Cerasicoccus maritimus TaxID=490089 RepID=UPI002852A30D|nr:replication-relaxation family protein [Cerasicoccus maritimus]
MQLSGKSLFLQSLAEYRCLTVRQSVAAGLASEQMTRRYARTLTAIGLIRSGAWQTPDGKGRPENMLAVTLKGLGELGLSGKELESRCYSHQYHLNWVRIWLMQLSERYPGLAVQFRRGSLDTLWPDGIVILTHEGKSLLFFLEIDMGTESLAVLEEKLVAYRDSFLAGSYKQFGESCRGFRVLLVCQEWKRLRGVARVCQKMAPLPFVWLTEYKSLAQAGAGAAVWSRGGELKPQFSILGSLAKLGAL